MKKPKTIEVTYCDGCGIEINGNNKGEFSVTAHYPTFNSVAYETGTGFTKAGDFCIDCCDKLGRAFEDALDKVGFVERHSMDELTRDKFASIVK